MTKILIATTNEGKYNQILEKLKTLPFNFINLQDLNIKQDVEENGKTYEENSIIKAKFFSNLSNLITIADDSGIQIEALKNELGVKTRRWGAGKNASDKEWLDYFLNKMSTKNNKNAKFISAITLYIPNKNPITFIGECNGIILEKPACKIEKGIPLSSVFLANGESEVFSSLDNNKKNEISHRGRALKKLYSFLKNHKTLI